MNVLEIGCGEAPELEHSTRLDARKLPGIDLVQSAVDLSNLDDASFDRVVAKDVIEHISWQDVPAALAEWMRVLRSGGALEVETPNGRELVAQMMAPQDPDLPRWKQRGVPESDWQRFCRTAFGHQDYPENLHRSYFTRPWLAELLMAAGAAKVDTLEYSLQRFRLSAMKP